jgi:hypothetical protein
MKSNPTRKIKQGICAYCGAVGDVTRDHIIPQCLWDKRSSDDVVPIVDACPQCNNIAKSENDTYLRDLLVNDQDAFQHDIVQQIRPKFMRSARENQSRMNRDFREHGKTVYTQRQSQLCIPGCVAEVADKRSREIIAQIVRGLHKCYLDEPLQKDTSFWIGRLRTKEQIEGIANDIVAFSGEHHRGALQRVGDGTVFSCSYVEMFAANHMTLWQLIFYNSVVFGVMTNPIQVTTIASD